MTRYAPLWQQAGSYAASVDRGLIGMLWPAGGATGGAVTAVTNTMTVSVAAGTVAVPLQAGQGSALCRWDAAEVVTIAAAPPSGQSRIDVVVAQVRDNALDAGGNNDFVFQAVTGTPAVSNPTVPATPTNALAMANVTVPGAAANLNSATLTDRRPVGHCEVYEAGAQSMAAGAFTKVNYDTVEAGNGFDLVNHWYVCPFAGRYLVAGSGMFTGSPSQGGLSVYRNGTEAKRGGFLAGGAGVANLSVPVSAVVPNCAASDTLALWLFNGAATATPIYSGAPFNYATFTYLGP
jgi:hypothetical protein